MLLPGLVNLRQVSFTTTDVRDRAHLAVSITQDFGGANASTTAAVIPRLSATNIDSTLRATWTDVPGYPFAIGRIYAANRISGDIIAGDADTTSSTDTGTLNDASIDRIVVGTSPTAEGIRANIYARAGKIGSILTTGPIGTSSTVRSKFQAGKGITEVRMVTEANKDATAAIGQETHTNNTVHGNNFNLDLDATFGDVGLYSAGYLDESREIGRVIIVSTLGDYIGSFKSRTLGPGDFEQAFGEFYKPLWPAHIDENTGQYVSDNPDAVYGRHAGILVRGNFIGTIETHELRHADIIAKGFTDSITIHKLQQGAIVAYGERKSTLPYQGEMPSIRVGYANPELYGGNWGERSDFGMTGVSSGPVIMATWAGVPGGGQYPHDPDIWFRPASHADSEYLRVGACDGLIRAAWIGNCEVFCAYLKPKPSKKRPRIEADRIDRLYIGERDTGEGSHPGGGLEFGVVWSGKLEYLRGGDGRVVVADDHKPMFANARANDFASVGDDMWINGIMQSSDVWYEGSNNFIIEHDLFGQVFVPSLGPCQILRIGDRLGDRSMFSMNYPPGSAAFFRSIYGPEHSNDPDHHYQEDSPRGINEVQQGSGTVDIGRNGQQDFGQIVVRNWSDPSQCELAGQIIIDANRTGATNVQRPGPVQVTTPYSDPSTDYWTGVVVVTRSPGPNGPSIPVPENPGEYWIGPNGWAIADAVGEAPYDHVFQDGLRPRYRYHAAQLGGGAVALAPASIYRVDCVPIDDHTFRYVPSLPPPIPTIANWQLEGAPCQNTRLGGMGLSIVFHGPIKQADAGTIPVIIERHDNGLWTDVTAQFEVTPLPTLDQRIDKRRIRLRANCANTTGLLADEYRVRRSTVNGERQLLSSYLLSTVAHRVDRFDVADDGGESMPPPYYDTDTDDSYHFRVAVETSYADVAGLGGVEGPDGQLTVDDLILFLQWFFSNNMKADIVGLGGYILCPDGQLTPDDIIYFLQWFFNPGVVRPGCGPAYCDMNFPSVACGTTDTDPCNPPMGMMMAGGNSGGGAATMAGPHAAPAAADNDEPLQAIPMPAHTRDQLVISRGIIQAIADALPASPQRTLLLQQLQQLDARINAIPVSSPGGPGE